MKNAPTMKWSLVTKKTDLFQKIQNLPPKINFSLQLKTTFENRAPYLINVFSRKIITMFGLVSTITLIFSLSLLFCSFTDRNRDLLLDGIQQQVMLHLQLIAKILC